MARRLISLTPTSELDYSQSSFGAYANRLDEIYKDSDLRNIAIIGNPGSGKSSILHSYDKKRHGGEEKFLYVSLIDFETQNAGKQTEFDSEQLKKRLEYSLLCQIIARCTDSDLRGSSIVGIPTALKNKATGIWAFLYLLITSTLVFGLVFHNRFGAVLRLLGFSQKLITCVHAIGYLLAFFLIFCAAWQLICKYSRKYRFGKFGIKLGVTEAEFNPSENYCLDQYKFEIIHILDRISKQIGYTVVFEDMERLDSEVCVDIMTKLRELNSLLNTNRLTQNKKKRSLIEFLLQGAGSDTIKLMLSLYSAYFGVSLTQSMETIPPVRFIYALSDKIFDSETRTKFYDTIVPVIPALNASNVKDTIINLLRRNETWVDDSRVSQLLDIIVTELTDFRTVRNVVSEFSLLKDIVEDNQGHSLNNPEQFAKLLSLSVYKVLFPKEYATTFNKPLSNDFPLPRKEHYADSRVAMVETLAKLGYLDNSCLKMVGFSENHLRYQRLDIIKNGTSLAKIELLCYLSKNDDQWIRKKIIESDLLFEEKDDDVFRVMAKYLYPTAKECIEDIMTIFMRDTLPSFLRFLLYLGSMYKGSVVDCLQAIDKLEIISTNRGGHAKVIHTYLKLMKALNYFSEAEISAAAEIIGSASVNSCLSHWLDYYSFSYITPYFLINPELYFSLNDLFPRTIIPCMGEYRHSLPKKLLRKRVGLLKISEHIKRYEEILASQR